MKKYFIILIMALGIMLLVSACGKKLTTYEEISYDDFKSKIKNKESFVLFVGSSTCTACDKYKITLNEFIEDYQIQIYYIDISKINNDAMSEFMTVINFSSTPTTVFITDGIEKTVYNRIVGALPYSKIVSKFEKAGYIKVK